MLASCAPAGPAPEAASPSGSAKATDGLFDQTLSVLRAEVDARREAGVPVPVPTDSGGGYTHEQHKQNGKTIYEAGML